MTRKHRSKAAQVAKKPVDNECCSCTERNSGEYEEEIRVAVMESVRRFLETNQGNIRKSSKEKTASASYSGGMVDMIETVRSVLGKWAVGQLLTELASKQRADDQSETPQCRVSVSASARMAGLTPEDAKELGLQIAKWIEGRKGNGKNQAKDPMFA
jgi:hypothetical protein